MIKFFKTFTIFFFIAILVVSAIKLLSFVKSTKYFQILHFKIKGNVIFQEEEIIKLANLKLKSNIFAIDSKKIERTFLKYPHIKEVVIKKDLPSTLCIQITERRPFALINIDGEKILGLDEEKVIFPLYMATRISCPIITGIKSQILPGEKVETPEINMLFSLLKIIKQINPLFFKEISEINIFLKNEPKIYLKGGTYIKLSVESVENEDFFWNFIDNYYELIVSNYNSLEYIDLRFTPDIIIKPKNLKKG